MPRRARKKPRHATSRSRLRAPGKSPDGRDAKVLAPPPTEAGAALTVAVAARPALFREILALELEGQPGLEVVGQARDEDGIRSVLSREKPRVLLLDYEGLGPNFEALIPRLRRSAPATRILVLATRSGDETVEGVLRLGAAGLVGKQQGLATLVRAIRVVALGELWANRRVTASAVEHMADGLPSSSNGRLTRREFEVTEAVARGLRNKDIARRLQISEKTVKSHLNNIFRKLQVDNRFAVGLYALDLKPES
jgi:two-component system, NarL family, nitrate/nitrite response regulator NarL